MKKNQNSDLFTFVAGLLIAAILVTGGLLLTKVLWPMLKWVAKKAWDKLRGKGKTVQEVDNETEPEFESLFQGNGLPTPDIFKGSPNLARARDLTF
ncbi:hypothetical protein [Pseudoduganella sp. R-34]|jgi:hypothetical protein|uniref:hypothetical protein n=1 Tax=Pseudoduganella sp. R-34 TaxID=3404062 RepID=UPI003CF15959